MANRDIFSELQEGLESYIDFQAGKKTLRTHKVRTVKPSLSAVELKEIRLKLNVSQSLFANALCAELKTYQNWEQGVSKPNKQAILLIKLIERNPKELEHLAATVSA